MQNISKEINNKHLLVKGNLLLFRASNQYEQAIANSYNNNHYNYYHVAIYVGNDNIIEAVPKAGVIRRKLLKNEVYDVYEVAQKLNINNVIEQIQNQIGKPYNKYFIKENKGFYCSELIQVGYNSIKPGLIADIEMNFENSKQFDWKKLYKNQEIPTQKLGTHPASIIDNNNFKKK